MASISTNDNALETDPGVKRAMAGVEGKRETFDALNGLRGIAAIAVVNAHINVYFLGVRSANVGLVVDFFFLLSGFVLAHAYGARLRSGLGALRFMAARVVRLYPAYLVALLIGAGAAWAAAAQDPLKYSVTLGLGLLMAPPPPAWSNNSYNLYSFDFPAWSICFELAANLIFGLVAKRLSDRVLAIIIGLSFVALIAVGLAFTTLDEGVRPEGFFGGLARVMFSFFAGVAVYRIWRCSPSSRNIPFYVLMVALILPLQLLPNTKMVWVYDLGVVAIYFPILLYFAAQSRSGAAWTWIAGALGAASYPLYILHVPIWNALALGFDASLRQAAPWSGIGLVAGLILLGWSVETFLDLPLRRRLARRLMGRPQTGATLPASVARP